MGTASQLDLPSVTVLILVPPLHSSPLIHCYHSSSTTTPPPPPHLLHHHTSPIQVSVLLVDISCSTTPCFSPNAPVNLCRVQTKVIISQNFPLRQIGRRTLAMLHSGDCIHCSDTRTLTLQELGHAIEQLLYN